MKPTPSVRSGPHRPHRPWLAGLLLAASLATLLPAALVLLAQRQLVQRAGQTALDALTQALGERIAQAVQAGDTRRLQSLLDSLVSHPMVASAALSDPQGRQLAHAGDAASASALNAQPPTAAQPWRLTYPLKGATPSGGPVAILTLHADSQAWQEQANRQAALLVLALLAQLVGLLVLLQAAAEHWWLKPLERLTHELALAGGAGLRRRLPSAPHAAGTLGPLLRAIRGRLEAQQRELEQARGLRAELERVEALYRPLHDMTGIHLFVCKLSGQLSCANPALRQLMGVLDDDADITGLNLLSLLKSPETWWQLVARARQTPHAVSADLPLLPAAGRPAVLHCRLAVSKQRCALGQGQLEGVMLCLSEPVPSEPAASPALRHDTLTGLLNAQAALGQGGHLLAQAAAADWPLTLLLINLDGLQTILEAHGQCAVDDVLVSCAERLRRLLRRASDLLARTDALQFLIGLPGVDAQDRLVRDLVGRVRQQFGEPVMLSTGARVSPQARIGLASYPRHATELDTLMHAAQQMSMPPWQPLETAVSHRVH